MQRALHAGHAISHPCGRPGCCGCWWSRGYGTKPAGMHLPHAPAAHGEISAVETDMNAREDHPELLQSFPVLNPDHSATVSLKL